MHAMSEVSSHALTRSVGCGRDHTGSPDSQPSQSNMASATLDAFDDDLLGSPDSSLLVLDDDEDGNAKPDDAEDAVMDMAVTTQQGLSGDDLLLIQDLLDQSDALLLAEVADAVDVSTLLESPPPRSDFSSGTEELDDEHAFSDNDGNSSGLESLVVAEETAAESSVSDESDSEVDEVDDTLPQLELLAKERAYLEAQVEFLQSRKRMTRKRRPDATARDDFAVQLANAKHNRKLLSELVQLQRLAMDNMRSMLTFAPVNDVRSSLMTPLESYIHLGTDFDERRQTILALREDKLATTRSFLEHKARGLNPELPYNYTDTFERFGKMYSVSFQLMKFTNISLGDVVDIVLEEHLGRDEELAKMIGCLSVREPYDCVHKSFLHQRVTTSLEWMGKLDDSSPVMDSNSLLYSSKHGNDSAIIAIDYIDQDDLHPYVSKDRIRKDATSGMVFDAMVDSNGVPCVLMKRMYLSKYHLHDANLSDRAEAILLTKVPFIGEKIAEHINRRFHRVATSTP